MSNKIEIQGNLGKDPEQKTGKNGDFYTFSLADKYKDITQWWNGILLKDAATAAPEFKKGDYVVITGTVKEDVWQDKKTKSVLGFQIEKKVWEDKNSTKSESEVPF